MELPVLFIGSKLSQATRQWLRKQGIQFSEQSFRRILYRKPNAAFFNTMSQQRKQWVITSSYAAHWLVRFKDVLGITGHDRIFCWSEKHARILKKTGLDIHISSYSKEAELSEQVLNSNEGESIIFLRGDKLHTDLTSVWESHHMKFFEVEVYKNTSVERFVKGMYDAYLFFSPSAIESFKASGNFPCPSAPVLANENSTARMAWKEFPNEVWVSPEQEELSFVKYAIARWVKSHENE